MPACSDSSNAGQPAVSVDAKKKENVGDFKNGGREWFPKGTPEEVRVYDFLIKSLGKAALYGVYDLLQNQGWMSVGIDHDTAQFAVNSIRRWWNEMGQAALSTCHGVVDHGGRRRQQQSSLATVESVAARVGGRVGDEVVRLSLSTRHEQMEQDRTSPVQLHHQELARPPPGQPRSDCQPDCQHYNATGIGRESGH